MTVSGALSTAISGLHANALQFRVAANNVVNANTPDYQAKEVRTFSQVAGDGQNNAVGGVTTSIVEGGEVDLATEFISMIQAKISYTANAKVIESSEEMIGALLDIKS